MSYDPFESLGILAGSSSSSSSSSTFFFSSKKPVEIANNLATLQNLWKQEMIQVAKKGENSGCTAEISKQKSLTK